MERTGTYLLLKEADAARIFDHLEKLDRKIQPLLDAQRPVMEDDYIDGKTAAAMIKMSTSTIYRLVQSGQLPIYKAGKRSLYKVSEVKALLTQKNI